MACFVAIALFPVSNRLTRWTSLISALGVWFGLVALLWRHRRVGWAFFVVGFASLWLLCTPVVADGLTLLAQRCPALDPNRPVDAQAVVILGGGFDRLHAPEYAGPIVEGIMLERVTLGAFLAKHYDLPAAVSGSEAEAATMTATLQRNFGITPPLRRSPPTKATCKTPEITTPQAAA